MKNQDLLSEHRLRTRIEVDASLRVTEEDHTSPKDVVTALAMGIYKDEDALATVGTGLSLPPGRDMRVVERGPTLYVVETSKEGESTWRLNDRLRHEFGEGSWWEREYELALDAYLVDPDRNGRFLRPDEKMEPREHANWIE